MLLSVTTKFIKIENYLNILLKNFLFTMLNLNIFVKYALAIDFLIFVWIYPKDCYHKEVVKYIYLLEIY